MGICLDSKVLFIFLLPIWVVVRFIIFRFSVRNNFSLKREIAINIFFIYILCLIGVTLFPLMIGFDVNNTWISINIIPIINTVKEILNITNDPNMHSFMIRFWLKNIVGNLILLLPLGIMMPMLWNKFNNVIKITLFAFYLSLSIEVIQLLSCYIGNNGRAFDIDDILLNTIGAYIGYIIYKRFIQNNKFFYKKFLQNI